ncbi:MAG: TetR/AcrR family transcriptional regulator [Myxococcota bacterium]
MIAARIIDPEGKRQAILDAALALFAQRGFHGTPVPLIAAQAGVAMGTVYRHFASKDVLVNALYRHWKQTMVDTVFAQVPPGAEVREQFRALWRGLSDFAHREPLALTFLELHHHAPYLDAASQQLARDLERPAEQFIAHAQERGVVRRGEPARGAKAH